jgi:hypothetical protein
MDSPAEENSRRSRREVLAYSIGTSLALAGCTSVASGSSDSSSPSLPFDLQLSLVRQPGQTLGGAQGHVGSQRVHLVSDSSSNRVYIGSTQVRARREIDRAIHRGVIV